VAGGGVVRHLPLAALPAQAQPFAYVANSNDGTVSVINTVSNTVVTTVPVGVSPAPVAVTPDGAFAFVGQLNAATSAPEVAVIATASNTVVDVVSLVGCGGLPHPIGIAITPDGAYAYVVINDFAFTCFGQVEVIATASNTVVTTVPVGTSPVGVAITPDGAFAYVTNSFSFDVSVIATASNTVVATVPVGIYPVGVAITPDFRTNILRRSRERDRGSPAAFEGES
jgi:YVTN family beta-propeller protein